jgi:glycosyltransferase involved in cell wall biosynthesis
VFSGPDSFLSYRELPLLRRLGKQVIYVFNGSDHRPPYLNGNAVRLMDERGVGWLAKESRRIKRRVQIVEKWADVIVALSSSAQFHARPFVHYLALGMPGDFPAGDAAIGTSPWIGQGVRVLHCPTDPVSKGTAEVRLAVSAVRLRGHSVDYVEMIGRPNIEVLARIRECDLVLDEVYSDTPMAGLATEAAWFGKPTLVTGYYAREMTDIPLEMIPPSRFLAPIELVDGLERLVVDQTEREELGRAAEAFVRSRWTASAVATRLLDTIAGGYPAAWLYHPDRLQYIHGWGMREDLLRTGIRQLVDYGGPEALLIDNANLRARALGLLEPQ